MDKPQKELSIANQRKRWSYSEQSKISPSILVKGMCGKRVEIDRWKVREMDVLSVVLAQQKGGNVLDLSALNQSSAPGVPIIKASDVCVVSQALSAYVQNDFDGYCNQFIVKTKVDDQKYPFKYAFGLKKEFCSLVNASYKVGANRIFQLCARYFLGLDMQKKVVNTSIDPVHNLIKAIDQNRTEALCKAGTLLSGIKEGNESASMLNFITDWLRQEIITKRVSARKIVLHAHEYSWDINKVCMSPDNSVMVSAGNGLRNNLRVWNPTTGALLANLVGHRNGVRVVAFSRDGKMLISAGSTGELFLWDATKWHNKTQLECEIHEPTAVAFSNNGRMILVGAGFSDNNLSIIDLKTGKIKYVFEGHSCPITCVGFSTDDTMIISVAQDGIVDCGFKTWDVATQRLIDNLWEPDWSDCSVEYGENGTWFLSGCRNDMGYWFSYNLSNQEKQAEYDSCISLKSNKELPVIQAVARSSGNKNVFVGDLEKSNSITVFDLLTGRYGHSLDGHDRNVTTMACSNDGTILVSGSRGIENNLIIWPLLITKEQEDFKTLSQCSIEQIGLIYDLCLKARNGFSVGLKEDSSDCLTFDKLPAPIKELLRDCVLIKKEIVDQGFLLVDHKDEWYLVPKDDSI